MRSDYPSRLKAMADFSLESATVTKLVPAAFPFLREVAAYITDLEAKLEALMDKTKIEINDLPGPPEGYAKLPVGVLCRCPSMWTDGKDHYCCKPGLAAFATREKRRMDVENGLRDEDEQPKPTPNQHPAVWDLVLADIDRRDNLGQRRYGTRLQPYNGRDVLRDAYEEALDLTVYLRQAIYERDGK